jgi:hypothetical protein
MPFQRLWCSSPDNHDLQILLHRYARLTPVVVDIPLPAQPSLMELVLAVTEVGLHTPRKHFPLLLSGLCFAILHDLPPCLETAEVLHGRDHLKCKAARRRHQDTEQQVPEGSPLSPFEHSLNSQGKCSSTITSQASSLSFHSRQPVPL